MSRLGFSLGAAASWPSSCRARGRPCSRRSRPGVARRCPCSRPPAWPMPSRKIGTAWQTTSGHRRGVQLRGLERPGAADPRGRTRRRVLLGRHRADGRPRAGRARARRRAPRPALEHARRDRAGGSAATVDEPARARPLPVDRGRRPAGGAGRRLRPQLAREPRPLGHARAARRADAPRPRGARRGRVRQRRGGHRVQTDAARSTRARIAFEVEPASGPPIRYPVAPLAAPGGAAAAAFVAYLRSPAARAVFLRHGFRVLGDQ